MRLEIELAAVMEETWSQKVKKKKIKTVSERLLVGSLKQKSENREGTVKESKRYFCRTQTAKKYHKNMRREASWEVQ